MITKQFFQFLLIILFFGLSIILYQKYFASNTGFQEIENTETLPNKKEMVTNEDEENSNIIENLKYVSEDLLGNKYEIIAQSATLKKDQGNQIELFEVNAKIIQVDDEIIYINSFSADYDKINNNTIFKDNVMVKYGDQVIKADIIKLNFLNNLIEMFENVNYTNQYSKVIADKVEINLMSKKLKISMNNQNDKVEIKGKY